MSVQTSPRLDLGPLTPFADDVARHARLLWDNLSAHPQLMSNLAWAAGILLFTLILSQLTTNGVRRLSKRLAHHDADRTLPEFLSQVVGWLILVVGLVAVLNRLGVQTASLITVLGAASLAIGLALQGLLGNVAAGLVILFNKPYRIGDIVQLGEVRGTVHRLGVFNTEIDNTDHMRVYVPNSKIFAGEIVNLSTNSAIRIEVLVDVDYDSDLTMVLATLKEVAQRQPERLSTHDPVIGLASFADSGITARVHIWVMPSHALSARTELIVDIKAAFDAKGIEIPYPHQVEVRRTRG